MEKHFCLPFIFFVDNPKPVQKIDYVVQQSVDAQIGQHELVDASLPPKR